MSALRHLADGLVAFTGGLSAGALTLHAIARFGWFGAPRRSRPHDLL